MSQVPDWNTSAPVQAIPEVPAQATEQVPFAQEEYGQQPEGRQQDEQQPQVGQPQFGQPQVGRVNPLAMMAPGGYPMLGLAPLIPLGMYYDQDSGLVLPEGTTLATVGRRIGAYFLGGLLAIVTLGIGYLIWGLIAWSKGQTPAQQVLGLQTWKPQEQVSATWGNMFLRGLAWVLVGVIPLGQIVSFFLFLSGKEHRALHDSMASTVVLHDPDKVLRPAPIS